MSKTLYIAEKPSVAREFAKVLGASGNARDGYLSKGDTLVTWCVGHLVTMRYPDAYDEKYKKWSLATLPFLPERYLYEVIPSAKNQFAIVKKLLLDPELSAVYVCTDAGREGEYIYRLVEMMSGLDTSKVERRRVWIDSQTEEEIRRGIREAKPLSEYDDLSDAAFLRAKEDYLMGINFSRLLTLKYSRFLQNYTGGKWVSIAVGRVMTCVLGMVVRREREIRAFVKTPFYRVQGTFGIGEETIQAMWHITPESRYASHPHLYKENGFTKREDAEALIAFLKENAKEGTVDTVTRKKESKNPPLLYNLAELQNEVSKALKRSPDETLQIVQELYEKKLVTYPRTDARVLSTGIAKEIHRNLKGLCSYAPAGAIAQEILDKGLYKGIEKTRYTNDKLVTDHYAIIPTGQGLQALAGLRPDAAAVYNMITARFLSVFYPAAVYRKTAVEIKAEKEAFSASFRVLEDPGYLTVLRALIPQKGKDPGKAEETGDGSEGILSASAAEQLRKGMHLPSLGFEIKEGESSPPKRYTSGSMILAMENAGQLIEDASLREQIKGSGIGTSATRAEILKKLFTNRYLTLNKKTQVITPALLGELIYDTVDASLRSLLNPELTASWEKGLTYVAEGQVTQDEYMKKLEDYVAKRVDAVKLLHNERALLPRYNETAGYYRAAPKGRGAETAGSRKGNTK